VIPYGGKIDSFTADRIYRIYRIKTINKEQLQSYMLEFMAC